MPAFQKAKRLLANVGLVTGAVIVTLIAIELLLRVAPGLGPKGMFGFPRYRFDLGLSVHGDTVVYNKVRAVVREPNSEGFLDIEHAPDKPPGLLRVGFFGDSYVEAIQVPLEQTFFRRLVAELSPRSFEALAFGVSGWGTLHSLIAYQVFGPKYDLDFVVYVFVKNDPGDHLASIQHGRGGQGTRFPAARVSEDAKGYAVEVRHLDPTGIRDLPFERQLERYSRLARSVRATWQWLSSSTWAEPSPTSDERIVNANDLPTQWPPAMLEEARVVTRRVLADFRDQVEADGRRFAVLYVPKGNEELSGWVADEDRWWPWLSRTCAELDVELIDSTLKMKNQLERGVDMFDDHWSPEGHQVISELMSDWIRALPGPEAAP